jgi:hypothetical protein
MPQQPLSRFLAYMIAGFLPALPFAVLCVYFFGIVASSIATVGIGAFSNTASDPVLFIYGVVGTVGLLVAAFKPANSQHPLRSFAVFAAILCGLSVAIPTSFRGLFLVTPASFGSVSGGDLAMSAARLAPIIVGLHYVWTYLRLPKSGEMFASMLAGLYVILAVVSALKISLIVFLAGLPISHLAWSVTAILVSLAISVGLRARQTWALFAGLAACLYAIATILYNMIMQPKFFPLMSYSSLASWSVLVLFLFTLLRRPTRALFTSSVT